MNFDERLDKILNELGECEKHMDSEDVVAFMNLMKKDEMIEAIRELTAELTHIEMSVGRV